MKPRSYAIVSCVHGRPAITEAWAKHIAANFAGPVVVAGDDPALREICEQEFAVGQLFWTPYANAPLGAKWNRAAERAIGLSPHCVILGSDDFPSPELFDIWEHITKLKYRWACLDSIYFYSTKIKEVSLLKSRLGFGTGRMFPSHALRDLFELKGYAWAPVLSSQLDASLYSNLGCPEDDIVLTLNESCWILAIKTAEQIHTYEKIRAAHKSMPVIHERPKPIEELIRWFHSQHGIQPLKPKRHPGTNKLYYEENKG